MNLDVSVQLHDARWKALLRPYCKTVREACEAAAAGVKLPRGAHLEMAVVLADDAFVHELNRSYRGYDKPTNVLSFASVEGFASQAKSLCRRDEPFAIGDIVLARETLEREAAEQGKSARHHALHLLVHGTLHLLGFDHLKAKEAREMEALEIKTLKKLRVSNPYL